MSSLDHDLRQRLESLRQEGLYRELRCVSSAQGPRIEIGGRSFLNCSSNDYLGLACEPALREAAAEAAARYGAGAGSSRLICGSIQPHHDLEDALAAFKGVEAAISFSSGYAAALGAIGAIAGHGDVVILDKLSHACLIDAAKLCGARLRVFKHNDVAGLERILRQENQRGGAGARPRILVVTESIFSMDGDHAPLREIAELKDQHGAWLMVDEAHGTGLYGANRRGLAEELGVSDRIEVQMGTLGKAFGAAGGYICGSRTLVEYLVNRARSFIFSTAPVPASAAAAAAGIRFVQSGAGEIRRKQLWANVAALPARLAPPRAIPGAIIPLRVGDESAAVETAALLRERGVFIPAVRYPTVPRGTARLRLTLTAAHTAEDLRQLQSALDAIGFSPQLPNR